jgi:hypothetical protein
MRGKIYKIRVEKEWTQIQGEFLWERREWWRHHETIHTSGTVNEC